MNLVQIYNSTKTTHRKEFEKNVNDKKVYQKDVKEMMNKVNKRIALDVDLGDDVAKRYAFCTVLKYIYLNKDSLKPLIKARDINDKTKIFLMNIDLDELIDKIKGNVDLIMVTPDSDYEVVDYFIPIHYQILFINRHDDDKSTTYTITKQDAKTKVTYEEEVERNDKKSRNRHNGAFFPFINKTNIDLSDYQIFNEFDLNNYYDNCFVFNRVFLLIMRLID